MAVEDTEVLFIAQDPISEVLADNQRLLNDFEEVRTRRAETVRRVLEPGDRIAPTRNGRALRACGGAG